MVRECPLKAAEFDQAHKQAPRWGKNHAGAKELAGGYTKGKRFFETACISSAGTMSCIVLYQLVKNFQPVNISYMIIGIFLGILTADFFSGLVHWACDSYGSVEMPMFGKAFIRPFREHHVDPLAITRHDFIETNGDNCLCAIFPLLLIMIAIPLQTEEQVAFWFPAYLYLMALAFFVTFTNQIHKWSHTYSSLPWIVEKLQEWRIILPKRHHRYHHVAPHEVYFCITTGWCDHPLELIRFWTGVEWCIYKITGVRAREDDLKWTNKK